MLPGFHNNHLFYVVQGKKHDMEQFSTGGKSDLAQPTSIMVDTFGTGKLSEEKLVEIVRENFDLRPAGIIKMLDLRRPIYKQTAAYGHFGRNDLNLPWEALDKVDALKKYL